MGNSNSIKGEGNESGIAGSRGPKKSDHDSNLNEVHPGTPMGVPAQHIYTHSRHALVNLSSIQAVYKPLDLPALLNNRILGFLGNFGSGKTEVAVNLAIQLGLAASVPEDPFEGPVTVLDLDIVNPYFRSREAILPLQKAGVDVVTPKGEHFWADLPIILPEIKGKIIESGGTLILDVGGDDLGARVLSHLNKDFPRDETTLCMVVNANRPFTSEIDGARKILNELDEASGMKISGLISNTHLMDDTTPDEIRRGYEFTNNISSITGLPVLMVTAESHHVGDGIENGLRDEEFECPLKKIYRFMLPPWKRSGLKDDMI